MSRSETVNEAEMRALSTKVRRQMAILAAAAYLGVAVVVWWHMWGLGLTHSIAANGYGDPDQDVWYLAWVPHALGNGLNPFISHAMFAPKGINLVVNTSIILPSLLLAPITVVFGPLVAFNVAVVLAPVANATALFVVLRRWAPFAWGRWVAGLFYGFSPFVLNDLQAGHLHMSILVLPPIALALLDDLVIRQVGNAVRKGTLLGVVLVAQFLTGQEVLAMMFMLMACGGIVLVLRHHAEARARWRRIATGVGTALGVFVVLLAYPLYLLLAGPRRFSGPVFKVPYGFVIWLKALVWPMGGSPPHNWPAYVGIPLVLLVAIGCWRIRSGALRFAGVMAIVALIFGLGGTIHWTPGFDTHIPLPDKIFSHWPLLKNLLPVRFAVLIDMFVAMAFAIVLDHVRDWIVAVTAPGRRQTQTAGESGLAGVGISAGVGPVLTPASRSYRGRAPAVPLVRRPAVLYAGLAALVLGLAAVASPAIGSPIPFPSRLIAVPAVFKSAALTHLPRGTTALVYPVANGFFADPLEWQAAEGMPYNTVAGYGFIPGPGPMPLGSISTGAAIVAFGDAQLGLLPPTPSPATVAAIRRELRNWHVSVIVDYPGYIKTKEPKQLASLMSAVTGRAPRRIDGADVWMVPPRLQ